MTDVTAGALRRDVKIITLVSTAHGFSHFLQLVLPPLFPFMTDAFGIGFGEAGMLMLLFYATSGIAQTPAGFLVDRFGARNVLLGGLALGSTSIGLIGLAPSFWGVLPLAVLAGLGNSVFHPADYSILTHTVSHPRMARAYGAHTLAGNIGWAAAPVTVLTLTHFFGWRGALLAVGCLGLAVVLLLASRSGILLEERQRRAAPRPSTGAAQPVSYLALLASRPILLCFAYFVLLSVALIGNQTFMPAALNKLYDISLATGNAALTAYLLAGSAGILAGGVLADRTRHQEWIVALGLLVAAAMVLAVGMIALPEMVITVFVALAGFTTGMTTPSRDMLVRGATPPGATGKVFGFVYSGLDLGSAVTPPVLGLLLDQGQPRLIFVLSAAALALTVLTAFGLSSKARRPTLRVDASAAE
ncbi:MAG TPA: MFS transporter [Stellaceae bacterium]|nr:MFS transporter [Stellaceae bacterium]